MREVLINLEDRLERKYFNKDIVSIEEVLDKLVDSIDEIDDLKDKIYNLEHPETEEETNPYILYGINEKDFN